MEVISLHSILSSYGDIVELDYEFSIESIEELKRLTTWEPVPNNRSAVNLTGPIDDLGQDSEASIKHARNQPYNDNLTNCPSLIEFFDLWTEVARCRAFKIASGGFFQPHRDAYRFNEQFRIFVPLNNTKINEHNIIYDGQIVPFTPLKPYILNTRKHHGGFSMAKDDTFVLTLSVFLNEQNLKTITKLLPLCSDR